MSSPVSVQSLGKLANDKSITATSFPLFSIHAVGQEATSFLTFHGPLESTIMLGSDPTLIGISSVI